MCIELGFPSPAAERALLEGRTSPVQEQALTPKANPQTLLAWQQAVDAIHVSPALLDYLQALLRASRDPSRFRSGLSPRAGLGLLRAARAYALIDQRDFVTPDDLRSVFAPIATHRVASREAGAGAEAVRHLLESVAVD